MVRYEQGKGCDPVAVFPDGGRVAIDPAARAYPKLEGAAADTADVYGAIAARLADRAVRVADVGTGSGEGARALAAAGLFVTGVDASSDAIQFARRVVPGVRWAERRAEEHDFAEFDAIVLVDLLGHVADDEAMLHAIARTARAGTTLIGSFVEASLLQQLVAPCRRAHSPETLDAMLVRTGWTAPTQVTSLASGRIVFESHRVADAPSLRLLHDFARVPASESAPTLLRLASAAAQAHDPSEARELLLAMGQLRLARGEHDLAEQAFTSANAIAPRRARPLHSLAQAALARGATDDAEILLDHALAYDETHAPSWRALGSLFASRGEYARAIECVECAALLEPGDTEIASELARLRARVGDAEGAAAALERVLPYGNAASIDPRFFWTHASETRVRSTTHARPSTGTHTIDPAARAQRIREAS